MIVCTKEAPLVIFSRSLQAKRENLFMRESHMTRLGAPARYIGSRLHALERPRLLD